MCRPSSQGDSRLRNIEKRQHPRTRQALDEVFVLPKASNSPGEAAKETPPTSVDALVVGGDGDTFDSGGVGHAAELQAVTKPVTKPVTSQYPSQVTKSVTKSAVSQQSSPQK